MTSSSDPSAPLLPEVRRIEPVHDVESLVSYNTDEYEKVHTSKDAQPREDRRRSVSWADESGLDTQSPVRRAVTLIGSGLSEDRQQFEKCEAWHLTWLWYGASARVFGGLMFFVVFAVLMWSEWSRHGWNGFVLLPRCAALGVGGLAMALLGSAQLCLAKRRFREKEKNDKAAQHLDQHLAWKVPEKDQGAGSKSVKHAFGPGRTITWIRMSNFLIFLGPAIANGVGFTFAVFSSARASIPTGCDTIHTRELCCRFMDGRSSHNNALCSPSLLGLEFPGGSVCEAQCVIDGNCLGGDYSYSSRSDNESHRSLGNYGSCIQIIEQQNYTHHLHDLMRQSWPTYATKLEATTAFIENVEFVGWFSAFCILIFHLVMYKCRAVDDCASHLEEVARLITAMGSVSAAAMLGVARALPKQFQKMVKPGAQGRPIIFFQMIFSIFIIPVGLMGVQVKVISMSFASTVPMTDWTWSEWAAAVLFANNVLRMGGNFSILTKPRGLITCEVLLNGLCKKKDRFVSRQQWLYKFEAALVQHFGKIGALVVLATAQDDEVHALLNERLRDDRGC